jgi:hypothetical protein
VVLVVVAMLVLLEQLTQVAVVVLTQAVTLELLQKLAAQVLL